MKEKLELTQEEEDRAKKRMEEAEKADYENKLRELSDFQETIEMVDRELERVDRDVEAFVAISDIILDQYGKVDSKIEWKWEQQAGYWIAKKEQEKISVERKLDEFKGQKKKLQRQRQNYIDQVESLSKSVADYEKEHGE